MAVRVSQIWVVASIWLLVDITRHLLGLSTEPLLQTIAADVTLAIFAAALTAVGMVNRTST